MKEVFQSWSDIRVLALLCPLEGDHKARNECRTIAHSRLFLFIVRQEVSSQVKIFTLNRGTFQINTQK